MSHTTSRRLTDFAAQLRYEALPVTVVDQIKSMILDQLGVANFVAKRTSWGKKVTHFAISRGGTGPSQVIGPAERTTPPLAAIANGTLAMGFEFEDMHDRGSGHAFSIVFPAVLAAAEAGKTAGHDLIAAVAAGYEVGVRASLGQGHDETPWTERGLYPITIFGVLGAAAGAARAMSLTPEATLNAIGIAGSHSFGTMQAHKEGSMTRRLHAGRAAEIGVTAALLAETGFTGPSEVIEGELGIYQTFGKGRPNLDAITADLGERWQTDGAWLKNYPCNGLFQAPLDALLQLCQQNSIKASNVREARATIPLVSRLHDRPPSEVTTVSAQFSLHYCMALALVRGHPTAEMFLERRVNDSDVLEAMSKVVVTLDPELRYQVPGASRPGHVELFLRDGRILREEVWYPRGHPRNPMNSAEVQRKCQGLVATSTSNSGSTVLEEKVRHFDEASSIPILTV